MRVTVGIPTYNRSAMLAETLKTVLQQTYTDYRILVSDNASEDDTEAVVRSFGDDRIQYSRSPENVGFLGNFRRVMELTETELLVILPDDDVLYPDHLRAAVDVFDRFQNVGLVHTAGDVIDADARVTERLSPLAADSPVTIERGREALERLMVADMPIVFPSVVYRTEAIRGADGMRTQDGPFGDIQLWMRIALEWDFGYVATPLAAFRVHEASITQNLGADHGVAQERRDLALFYAGVRLERRMAFLEEAPLPRRSALRLGTSAKLHALAERAYWGLPTGEVVKGQAQLARVYPPIVLRPAFWRLAAAQFGGRWLNSMRRRVLTRPGG
jgi:glycosyltransferase involved in cell wall biosynthesis